MICGRIIWAEEGKGNLDIARRVLKDQFGLVPPHHDILNPTEEQILVWEDSEGIGRYRVHFYDRLKHHTDDSTYDAIQFKYWTSKLRVKREILEQDPMCQAYQGVRVALIGHLLEENLVEDLSVEEIMRLI